MPRFCQSGGGEGDSAKLNGVAYYDHSHDLLPALGLFFARTAAMAILSCSRWRPEAWQLVVEGLELWKNRV